MSQKEAKKLHVKYSESGRILFTATQTKRRLSLCKEALSNNKSYSIRFKDIYKSQVDIENKSIPHSGVLHLFTERYFELQQRAWGGAYKLFNSGFASAEGAFFPFVRTKFNSHMPVDEGCIWIGSMTAYPLIYVQNGIAKWVCPYSKMGFVRKEPFLPFAEARSILPRLMNKAIYPDLNVEIF